MSAYIKVCRRAAKHKTYLRKDLTYISGTDYENKRTFCPLCLCIRFRVEVRSFFVVPETFPTQAEKKKGGDHL